MKKRREPCEDWVESSEKKKSTCRPWCGKPLGRVSHRGERRRVAGGAPARGKSGGVKAGSAEPGEGACFLKLESVVSHWSLLFGVYLFLMFCFTFILKYFQIYREDARIYREVS